MLSSRKTDLTTIINLWSYSLFKDNYYLNQLWFSYILIHSYTILIQSLTFSYSPGLLFIFSIRFLISSERFVYFFHISLFLSVEAKLCIDFHFLLNVSIYFINKIHRTYTINIFIIKIFRYDTSNIININAFVWLFVYF